MFDAFLTAVVADRDRACLVASFPQEEKVWSPPVRVEADATELIVFDIRNTVGIAEMAGRLQSLPPDEEKPGVDIDMESDGIL